jgi:hypothetical protein
MIKHQFQAAALNEIKKDDNYDYVGARYAPTGNQTVGDPFPLFKQPAYYFTDWTPNTQTVSNMKRQMNLPTNNTLFRNSQEKDGVNIQNNQNTAWMYRTQTLSNNGEVMACRNNADCSAWPGTTCNPNYQSWSNAHGNQGNYCSETKYPEMTKGVYNRKDASRGGIGKACSTDNDCAMGYSCNNDVDMFGNNVQQTGYCSQTYECEDGIHHAGYPYNSGIPMPPPLNQNKGGVGYNTKEECDENKVSQQDCVRGKNGNWFATYPAYCPIPTNMRKGGNPLGALPSSNARDISNGIRIPAYATNKSSMSEKKLGAFSAWNINSSKNSSQEMSEPLRYELSINPKN